MNGNIRIGNLFGIPFFINPSWFLVLGLVTWSNASGLAQLPQLTGIMPWILGLVTALLLFSSVLAHELGHSFVAIAQGIPVKSITLFIFGGLATLEKESETPFQAFSVAIAGPVVSVLLYGLFTLVAKAPLSVPIQAVVSFLAYINLILALFNMIPGLPLDGGNVLKAIVWKFTGNPNKGVIFAGRVGQVIGWIAIALGIMSILGISQVGSIWTLLIGTFLLQNAGFAAQSATVQDKLSRYTAEDAVITDSPVASQELSVREFVNNYVIGKEHWRKFLIVDQYQQLVGSIMTEDLKSIPTSQWNDVLVQELVKPVPPSDTIAANTSLLEVAKLFELGSNPELVVVRETGEVVGLIEKASIIKLMAQEAEAKGKAATATDAEKEEVMVN
ncbi:MAG: site-2 protease family protein [Cyanobacteria bacterium J06621_8]